MKGDVHDLLTFFRDSETKGRRPPRGKELRYPFWTENERRIILKAAVDLIQGFRESEEAHRAAHGIHIGKQAREAVWNPHVPEARTHWLTISF